MGGRGRREERCRREREERKREEGERRRPNPESSRLPKSRAREEGGMALCTLLVSPLQERIHLCSCNMESSVKQALMIQEATAIAWAIRAHTRGEYSYTSVPIRMEHTRVCVLGDLVREWCLPGRKTRTSTRICTLCYMYMYALPERKTQVLTWTHTYVRVCIYIYDCLFVSCLHTWTHELSCLPGRKTHADFNCKFSIWADLLQLGPGFRV